MFFCNICLNCCVGKLIIFFLAGGSYYQLALKKAFDFLRKELFSNEHLRFFGKYAGYACIQIYGRRRVNEWFTLAYLSRVFVNEFTILNYSVFLEKATFLKN